MKHDKKKIKPDIPVAIIGIGCLFPKAAGVKEYWRLLYHGEDAITEVPETHWSIKDYFHSDPKTPDHTYCKRGGFLSPVSYDPSEFGIPPNLMEATDTSQLLGLIVAKMALEDAGYKKEGAFDREKTSVILGVTGTQELVIPLGARLGHPIWRRALEDSGATPEMTEEVISRISEAYVPWQENSFPGLLGNVIPGRISNRFNLGGTNTGVDAACASSLSAINLAVLELISGRNDMVITGGVDTLNDIFMHMCFSKTSVLSHTGDAKPFSQDADGTVLGEGIGMVVLKRLEDAVKDDDRIYAVIKSIGTSSDGKSGSIYAPNAAGQKKALQMAYRNADVSPATIELLEAHGTGTRVGDAVEFQALKEVYSDAGSRPGNCALGSVKSNIGHCKASAGVAGLIKAALSLHHKVLPPTLKVGNPDPKLSIEKSPFYLIKKSRPWFSLYDHPRRSGISAFGFGGSNFHTILEEYEPSKNKISWNGTIEIVALSASTKNKLKERLASFSEQIEKISAKENFSFSEISFPASKTRGSFSSNDKYRLLMVLERSDKKSSHSDSDDNKNYDFINVFKKSLHALESDNPDDLKNIENVFYGESEKPGQVAFIFPGQGSQYVDMGKDLICTFPEAQSALEDANRNFLSENKGTLGNFIYPHNTNDNTPGNTKGKKRLEDALRSTDIAQPSIGAISLSMLNVLQSFGIRPDAVCGHSFGELTALCCAGRINVETFYSLSTSRGRFMAATGGAQGSMLAVKAPLDEIDNIIEENNIDVILANRNSYEQGILSGSKDAVSEAEKICRQKGFRTTPLPVAAAFHSRLVEDAAKPFKKFLKSIDIISSDIPVLSNTTGKPYPDDQDETKKILGNQFLKPVDFVSEIENLYETGVHTFVEIGPKTVLTGLVKSILKGRDFTAVAMDGSAGRRFGISDLAKVLCNLASLGYGVEIDRWEETPPEPEKQNMSIPISGANYWLPPKPKPKKGPQPVIESKPETEKTYTQKILKSNYSNKPVIDKTRLMSDETKIKDDYISNALNVVQESIRSMQALQKQTAEAHSKFLETQTEAAKTLQVMMGQTQRMAEATIGIGSSEVTQKDSRETTFETQYDNRPDENINNRDLDPQPYVANKPALPDRSIIPESNGIDAHDSGQSTSISADIEKNMLDIVAHLTGYPVEMLGMEMDIEADLGIDSIKRVEILSTLEEKMPDLPAVSPEAMGELKTLGQIVDYLSQGAVNDKSSEGKTIRSDGPGNTEIETNLLDIVSNLTGYPVEMLDTNMDIEADLGIDSIKRVEILSTLEEKMPNLPAVSPEAMGELKTLGQIIEYLLAGAEKDTLTTEEHAHKNITASGSSSAKIEKELLDIVAQLTGYPVEMLGSDMDIEADLGIDSIKRVEILSTLEEKMPDLPAVSPEAMGELKTLGQIVDYLSGGGEEKTKPAPHDLDSSKIVETVSPNVEEKDREPKTTLERQTISIVETPFSQRVKINIPESKTIYITKESSGLSEAIAAELDSRNISSDIITSKQIKKILKGDKVLKNVGGLIIIAGQDNDDDIWNKKIQAFLKNSFVLAKHCAPGLIKSSESENGGAVFATITRLDGCFGFKGKGVKNPLQGGLAGLSKTASIEWENVACRAVDIDPSWRDNKEIADAIVSELLNDTTTIEIGLTPERRYTLKLKKSGAPDGKTVLIENDVVVITGGARGVTAACAQALAEQIKPVIVLLGRSPEPKPEPEWLKGLTIESHIKKGILENEFKDKKTTPKKIEKSYQRHYANREISKTLEELKEKGVEAFYYSADVRDQEVMNKTFDKIREKHGPVKALIHGAGILEDKFITDKSLKQFERVYDTKTKGLRVLLEATKDDSLKYIVLFSSVSARQGNKGQVDYAMANEVLNKVAHYKSVLLPECKIISINWGPWDGGMVSPLLKNEFRRNNIELIPVDTGARYMVNEMKNSRENPVEIIIGATMHPDNKDENIEPVIKKIKRSLPESKKMALSFNRDVNIDTFPILESHILNGEPVVPFALMAEWFGHGALHGNPGLRLHGIDDMRLLKGIRLNGQSRHIQILAGKTRKNGLFFEVDVELRNGDGAAMIHSKAKAILTEKLSSPPEFSHANNMSLKDYPRSMDEAYEKILFHGSQLKGIKEVIGYSSKGMTARLSSAPDPEKWITDPLRSGWIGDPLVLDSAYQLAILYCFEETGVVSLPSYSASYRQYSQSFPPDGVTAVLEVTELTDHKMTGDFTFLDSDNTVVATISGYEAVMDISLNNAFKPEGIKV